MELIHTKIRMKDQGSHELVDEALKERKNDNIDDVFHKSVLHILDGFYE